MFVIFWRESEKERDHGWVDNTKMNLRLDGIYGLP
jgi:hypothetical protein